MKHIKTISTLILISLLFNSCAQNNSEMNTATNLYDININSIDSDSIDLSKFKGKFILFVNVASKCAFTPQYKDLQELHNTYKDQLVIIGVPCNQFAKQEPGNASEIQSFCSKNYGVEFLITEKVAVKGKEQHPLYNWLTSKEKNGVKNSSVKWNFQKYLINKEGILIDYFYSTTNPSSKKITKYFN